MKMTGVKLPAFPPGEDTLTIITPGTTDTGETTICLSIGRPILEETAGGEVAASVVMDLEGAKRFGADLFAAIVDASPAS